MTRDVTSRGAAGPDFYTSPFPLSIPSLEHLARDSRKIADHMIERRVGENVVGEVGLDG